MSERLYCTINDVVDDLTTPSSETSLFGFIEKASQFIERRIGNFIPITATRKFDGTGRPSVQIRDLLAATTVTYNGTAWTSTQYNLYPLNRCWPNGPYSRVEAYLTSFAAYPGILSILGRWGLYEESVSTGLTVASQSATAATLALPDSIQYYPGTSLLIGTEQELITGGGTSIASSLRTYTVQRGVSGTTAAIHTTAAVSQYIVPPDVTWLCAQIAGLMRMKKKSNYAGKTGNADLGETFYFNEFPSQIKDIKKNYRVVGL